jgi:hypothetical protein
VSVSALSLNASERNNGRLRNAGDTSIVKWMLSICEKAAQVQVGARCRRRRLGVGRLHGLWRCEWWRDSIPDIFHYYVFCANGVFIDVCICVPCEYLGVGHRYLVCEV